MKRYTVSPEAEQDLVDIKAYLTEMAGAPVARRILKQIRQAVNFLSLTPGAGHLREDITEAPVKFWPVFAYQIIYRQTPTRIEIVRILHGNRDMGKLL